MGLSQSQRTILTKAMSLGAGGQGVRLDAEQGAALLSIALGDLG